MATEKEEVMEPLCNWTADNQNKPKAISFFPLWKLKDNQPIKTPTVQVAQLEQYSTDKEESVESDDPDGIEGIMEEFIVHLALGSEGTSMGWEVLLPLQQPILSTSACWWRHPDQLPI